MRLRSHRGWSHIAPGQEIASQAVSDLDRVDAMVLAHGCCNRTQQGPCTTCDNSFNWNEPGKALRVPYLEAMYPAKNKQAEYGLIFPMEADLLRVKVKQQMMHWGNCLKTGEP